MIIIFGFGMRKCEENFFFDETQSAGCFDVT